MVTFMVFAKNKVNVLMFVFGKPSSLCLKNNAGHLINCDCLSTFPIHRFPEKSWKPLCVMVINSCSGI